MVNPRIMCIIEKEKAVITKKKKTLDNMLIKRFSGVSISLGNTLKARFLFAWAVSRAHISTYLEWKEIGEKINAMNIQK
jgi:hypothetical protein